MEFTNLVSTEEILKHDNPSDLWLVIDDQVWDVTSFAPEHPGGLNRKRLKHHNSRGQSLI